ncbi:hypothetical protein [Chitinophaga tropicalis]|uniref:HNH endonuclease n=1 Tax=Chitinophaga tropicalis TaxID=2683588 RepID=A0A7K1U0B6_9BACT|nr:hypothetical protein [Chitinophaga tropicalis]MVT07814.1 hypothetical protein [Chitinophaga tropicalis]
MARSRDGFTPKTIRTLEVRVGTTCSNPTCRINTTAAHTNPDGVLRIGVAAHIKAAAPGGPRYDPNMTPEQRSDISNGIWLCQNCARMIDVDDILFPVDLLMAWKAEAEGRIRAIVTSRRAQQQEQIVQPVPYMDVELVWTHGGRFRRGISHKNPLTEVEGRQVILVDVGDPIIIHWDLDWNYELRLYNNSRREMFNVAVEFGEISFDEITSLPNINNLEPLSNFSLTARAESCYEGIWKDADIELRRDYPIYMEGMTLTVRYRDDQQQQYTQTYRLQNGDFEKMP